MIKQSIITICLSLTLIGVPVGYAYADSVNVSYFFEGLDLDLGKEEIDPTVLFLMMGETIEELLRPDVDHLNDFKPSVDFSFDFDLTDGGLISFVLHNNLKIALVEGRTFDEIDGTILGNVEFTDTPLNVPIDDNTILLAWTADDRAFKLNFSERPDLFSVDVGYVKIYDGNVPEPSTIVLLGLGVIGVILLVKRRKRFLMIITIMFVITIGNIEIANAQTEPEPITVVKEESTGDGTIVFNEYKCEPGCKEFTIPYSENVGVLLKAIPDSESRFVRWKTPEKRIIEGQFKVQPGETIIALFQNKYELFTDDPYVEGTPDTSSPTQVRGRYVQFFPDVIDNGEKILFNLFEDAYFEAIPTNIQRVSETQVVWSGHIPGANLSDVTIIVERDRIVGNIRVGEKMYGIRSVDNGLFAVFEIDQSAFPDEASYTPPKFRLEPTISSNLPKFSLSKFAFSVLRGIFSVFTPSVAYAQTPTIDVMAVYTEDARNGAGGSEADIVAQIRLAVQEANDAYARSGVQQRLRLVQTREVNYTETGNLATDVNNLRNGNIDNMHRWRDEFGADLVNLWVENGGGFCGRAFDIMQTVSHAFESDAYSVVVRDCAVGNLSFVHELAHNMSARHDWYADPTNNSPYTYNHGFINHPDRWRTIMSYNTECDDNGYFCRRIGHFSNPDVDIDGDASGIAEGDTNAADNRQTLNNTNITVANFRDTDLGGVSLWQYCRNRGYDGTYLGNQTDPNSWRCQKRDEIDVTQACVRQYGSGAWAEAKNWNNAYSWTCYSSGGKKELGGVSLWQYCRRHGYDDVYLGNSNDAGSWKCADGISVNRACQEQYHSGAWAEANDWGNAYSWTCYDSSGELGGVSLWQHCRRHGYDGAYLEDEHDAGSWKCGKELSVNNACKEQYHSGAWAEANDWGNAYSWMCYENGKKERGGVDLYGYCRDQGYNDVYLGSANDAGSWRCQSRDDIEVTQACREQKREPNAYARPYDWGDAFSWNCYLHEW